MLHESALAYGRCGLAVAVQRWALVLVVVFSALFGVVGQAVAADAEIPAAPTQHVTDRAGMLSPAVAQSLNSRLRQYEGASGHQVIVWIGQSTEGVSVEEFAVKAFETWGVGRKGVDDGLALFLFADDRKIRIEVGYGLEGTVTDLIASQVIRDVMTPQLKAGQADRAVVQGVETLVSAIEGRPNALPGGDGTPPPSAHRKRRPPTKGELIVGGILLLGFLVLLITNPRAALFLMYVFMSGGRGGGGGGGFGGGGFGGGGGRSGGGGASGGW